MHDSQGALDTHSGAAGQKKVVTQEAQIVVELRSAQDEMKKKASSVVSCSKVRALFFEHM